MNTSSAPSLANDLEREAKGYIEQAKTIAKTAESGGRDFTPAERSKVRDLVDQAEKTNRRAAEARGDSEHRDLIKSFEAAAFAGAGHRYASGAIGSWASAYMHSAKDALAPSGSLTVPSLSVDIAPLQDAPQTFLQAIDFVTGDVGDQFEFVQEHTRTLNAATVAPGRVKPTSVVELIPKVDRHRVFAHLAGPVARSTIADSGNASAFLQDVLREGLVLALEHAILKGDSTNAAADDFDGLYKASGVRVQHFHLDMLTTVRKSITTLQKARIAGPYLIVMNSTAWETLELLTSSTHFVMGAPGAQGAQLPIDTARQSLFGQRVAITQALDDDECVVGDFSPTSIRVRERQGATIDWSEAVPTQVVGAADGTMASGFEVNSVMFRCESRHGLELRRPGAFVLASFSGVEGS